MKKGAHMTWIFVLFFIIGAFGIQIANAWLAKTGVNINSFLLMIPLLLIAQYMIASGYAGGTENFSFVRAHILWTAILIVATLVVNFFIYQTIPGYPILIALGLAGVASVIAVLE
jgi:hypothetical protein